MKPVRPALLLGVALIVENPENKIMVLREGNSKPWLGKYAGMYSVPMETKKGVRERDQRALARLVAEELHGLEVTIEPEPRGSYRVVWGARASLYLGRTLATLPPAPNGSREVSGHVWVCPEEALKLWLRRGAKEMIVDYIAGERGVDRTFCKPVPRQYSAREQ